MATCPLVGSQQASPATEEGGAEGTGEVPVLPSKRGFTPLLPPNAPGGVFPGWMVLFLGGGGVIQWGLQSPWDGSGLGLARREVHRWAGGLGCSSRCCAPSSRQQPQPGHLGRQEGVDDEDDGLGAGVKVQLLQKRKGGMFAMGRAVPAAASFQPGTTQSSPNPPQLYWGPGKGCAPWLRQADGAMCHPCAGQDGCCEQGGCSAPPLPPGLAGEAAESKANSRSLPLGHQSPGRASWCHHPRTSAASRRAAAAGWSC